MGVDPSDPSDGCGFALCDFGASLMHKAHVITKRWARIDFAAGESEQVSNGDLIPDRPGVSAASDFLAKVSFLVKPSGMQVGKIAPGKCVTGEKFVGLVAA